jgi:hypothetical protein
MRKRQERHERSIHLTDEKLDSYRAILRIVGEYQEAPKDPGLRTSAGDAVAATLKSREADFFDYADCLPQWKWALQTKVGKKYLRRLRLGPSRWVSLFV